jgi:hypothetical protein
MDENPQRHDDQVLRATTPAVVILLLVVALFLAVLPFLLGDLWHLREYAAFALFVPSVGLVAGCLWFVRTAPIPAPRWLCYAGCVFVLGGIAFDLFSTLLHSPGLEREANVVARYLLDSGHSLGFVYAFGAVGQLCVALVLCGLWIAFVKHLPAYLGSSYAAGHSSFLSFVKAAMGSGKLTWWQVFFSVTAMRRVSWYHVLCFAIPFGVLFGGLHRWYLALHWFGMFHQVPRAAAIAIMIAAYFVVYILWLFSMYRRIQRTSLPSAGDDVTPTGSGDCRFLG